MRFPRPVLVLRLACLAALAASAALTADALRPDRRFCPLAAACDKAKASALGSILGVPTSTLGFVAFGGLLFLTLLPLGFARKLVRPAAWFGALAGFIFVSYQALFLRAFCPICLIADVAALVAGAAAMFWQPPYLYRGKRKPPVESMAARVRWLFAGQLAVALPLLWPAAPPRPSWVPLPQGSSIDFAAAFGPTETTSSQPAPRDVKPADPSPETSSETPPSGESSSTINLPRSDATDPGQAPSGESRGVAFDAHGSAGSDAGDHVPNAGAPKGAPSRAGKPTAAAPAKPKPTKPSVTPRPERTAIVSATPPPPARREIVIVEYLNPFCAHCRATHARLERVIPTLGVPVRRHRVLVWPASSTPMWAGACACASLHGVEEQMFDALVRSPDQDPDSIYAAAQSAGLDPSSLSACANRPEAQARIERDLRLAAQSRIEGLPTLDIGRRRLMGEQSEEELRDALMAAISD